MPLSDWEELEAAPQSGGQGTVTKVKHRNSHEIGALKQLHKDNEYKSERRFRFLNEVSALRALQGDGVPRVLDAEEYRWTNQDTHLYLVMEWINGQTLSQMVNAHKATIDEAKEALMRICHVLELCHKLPIYHRDIKPDNIVMRGNKWSDPVLVDFGMSWTKSDESQNKFNTPNSQEIGNRFLRLPEHAAGGNHYDNRSDLSMAVGLLFFMLTGRAPRSLENGYGLKPHQAHEDAFPSSVVNDPRWPRLRRMFYVGFQLRIEARIQNTSDLNYWLKSLDDDAMDDRYDELAEEIARFNDTLLLKDSSRIEEARSTLEQVNRQLFEEFQRIIGTAGLVGGGQGPIFLDRGLVNRFYLNVHRENVPEPATLIEHHIFLENESVSAGFRLDQFGPGREGVQIYYTGPGADVEGLMLATSSNVKKIAVEVIRSLRAKWGG